MELLIQEEGNKYLENINFNNWNEYKTSNQNDNKDNDRKVTFDIPSTMQNSNNVVSSGLAMIKEDNDDLFAEDSPKNKPDNNDDYFFEDDSPEKKNDSDDDLFESMV